MGQATVDLPDPMQSPAAPATAGTDDLLAQLAGDEIERLLAETETERPAAPAAASPLPDVAAKSAPIESPAPLPSAPASSSGPGHAAAQPPDSPAAAAPAAAKENLTTQLDALFESLNGAGSPPAQAPAPPAPVETIQNKTGVTPPGSIGSVAAAPIDTASSAAELKALGQPIAPAGFAADAAALAENLDEAMLPDGEDDIRPSLLVRLLEILNSPLGGCSDSVRQTVGKIAIATLLNAIAVLAYTLVFRHR